VPSASKDDPSKASTLGRAKTSALTVTGDLTRGSKDDTPVLARANTFITPARASPNVTMGGPARGISLRRPAGSPTESAGNGVDKAPEPPTKDPDNRLTEFYDDYLDSYSEAPPPMPRGGSPGNGPPDRVAAWARTNANANYPPTRMGSRSAPASNYAPSSYGGGSLRRKLSRRPTQSRTPSRIQSPYEEEEEGYVSGEYEDGPFELIKIRVRLHYQEDVRGMALAPETPFDEFLDKVTAKFGKNINGLTLKFKDEDGGKVTLRDDMDYELAIETARESSKGKPEGKLEIWCVDV
jgi:neutrophil factor 2